MSDSALTAGGSTVAAAQSEDFPSLDVTPRRNLAAISYDHVNIPDPETGLGTVSFRAPARFLTIGGNIAARAAARRRSGAMGHRTGSMAPVAQPSPLTEVHDRARAMRDAGDLTSAIAYLRQALEAGRSAFGDDDPQVLRTGHLLAVMHRDCGDPAAARRVLEESLAAGEFRLGETHPVLLAIAFDLGLVADELGNRHEARRNLARVAAAGPTSLGTDHWQVVEAERYLRQWSVDTLVDHPLDQRANQPANQPTEQPMDRPTARPVDRPTEQPVDRPTGQLAVAGRDPSQHYFAPAQLSAATADAEVAARPARTGSGAGVGAVPSLVAIGAAAAAVIAAIVAVAVGVTLLLDRPGPSPTQSTTGPVSTSVGEPPGGLRLSDDGTAVTLSWSDPTAGTVAFIVASGRDGQQLAALATVNPGRTTFTVNGLNPDVDYCFAVLAVYSADEYSPSEQVCTQRRVPDFN